MRRRLGSAGGAMAILGFANWLLVVGPSPATLTSQTLPVPLTVGSWQGRRLDVPPRAREILQTDEVTLVDYRLASEEQPVWFAQVEGFGTRAAFHPPELCYVGSHFEVLERTPITVVVQGRPHRLMRLVVGQEAQRFEAWYWFTANGRVTPSYYQQQLWLLADAIHRKPLSGTLVRLSTPLDQPSHAHRRLSHFLESLVQAQLPPSA